MNRIAVAMLCLSAAMPLTAHAQIYLCKDASGKAHTSDRPIAECADRAVREFSSNGLLKREVPAPLTAEQKRQKQLEEERRKAAEAALAEQRQADRALLARYRNEADIEIARKRALEILQEQFNRQMIVVSDAEKRLKDAQAEIARAKAAKDAQPTMQRRLEESDQALRDEKKRLQDAEADVAQFNAKFDATLKRYRELTNSESAASK
jgi:hypothetical protein